MKTTKLVPAGTKIEGTACKPLAPEFKSAPPACCPTTCEQQCPPRVRLKDYIVVKPSFAETCLTIGEDVCQPEVLAAAFHCFMGSIRKRGDCKCLLRVFPVRATPEGAVCFAWGEDFWLLGDGRYEMDITIDGECQLTVGLDVRGCHQAVLHYEHRRNNSCNVAPQCAPQLDDEPYTSPSSNCGDCDA